MEMESFDKEVGLLRHEGASPDDVEASPFHAQQEVFVTFGAAIDQVMSEPEVERWRYEITGDGFYLTGDEAGAIAASAQYRAWQDTSG